MILIKFTKYVGYDTRKSMATLFHAWLECFMLVKNSHNDLKVSNIMEKTEKWIFM